MDNLFIDDVLSAKGPFAAVVSNFSPRKSQQAMAKAVEKTLTSKSILVVEAGTGTGKTFAYLAPSILSHEKVLISTGTKNLQDQLVHKDLPILKKALKTPFQVALLKGRSNYLCKHRLELSYANGRFPSREVVSAFYKIQLWSKQTKQGDIAELSMIPEGSAVFSYITSTKENCLGQDCAFYKECFLMKARQKAIDADVIVVNHHLFFADIVLKDSGFGELLPSTDAVIFDEAHQISEIASQFFGRYFSSRQLLELARDTKAEALNQAKDFNSISNQVEQLEKAVLDFRLAFGPEKQRKSWQDIMHKPSIKTAINKLIENSELLSGNLKQMAERSKGLKNCYERCLNLFDDVKSLTSVTPNDQIHWYETFKYSFSIHFTPLSVANSFKNFLNQDQKAWIFTSATLAVADCFDFFQKEIGLEDTESLLLQSEFNFSEQAILYIPKDIPEPPHPSYNESVVRAAIPVIQAAQGRTFFLFTSHHALQQAARLLENQIEYPLLVQGLLPKRKMLEQYRALGNAVLLGTNSFWEGVDVKGEALSCVIIDKLPFASPNDPILKARLDAIRRSGGDPFKDHQISQAVISLKQGVGRLIRDASDRGVLMLCDPRLLSRPYGTIFLESLPKMKMTRFEDDVEEFFSEF